jgi:catechol 2,3-dioxygenase-like lactoylglutathione lyase family enzyme
MSSSSLRRFFSTAPVQHVGVNVEDMAASKRFYAEVLGAEFVAEAAGITGANWNVVLNGTALADGKKVPDLASGDALDVAFYSFGNTAVELLRYYNVATGETFPGPLVAANEQGPAGMHLCFR